MKRTLLIATISVTAALASQGQSTAVGAVGVNGSTTVQQPAPPPPSHPIPGVVVNATPAPATAAPAANAPGQTVARPAIAFPTTNAAPIHSNITPVQMQNINRLDQELSQPASVAQQRQLMDTLEAAPIASVRPSAQSISTLGATLAAVTPSLRLTPSQRRQLAIDVNMALNSANLSPAQSQRVVEDARSLLQMVMARNPQGVEQLVGDLSLMVGQVQGSLMQPDQAAAVVGNSNEAPAASQAGQSAPGQTGQGSGSSTAQAAPTR